MKKIETEAKEELKKIYKTLAWIGLIGGHNLIVLFSIKYVWLWLIVPFGAPPLTFRVLFGLFSLFLLVRPYFRQPAPGSEMSEMSAIKCQQVYILLALLTLGVAYLVSL